MLTFLASDFQEAFRRRNRQPASWQLLVRDVSAVSDGNHHPLQKPTTQPGQVWYIINLAGAVDDHELRVELFHATCKRDGSPGKIKKLSVQRGTPKLA